MKRKQQHSAKCKYHAHVLYEIKKKILNSLKYFSVKIIAHANGLNSTQHVQQTSCVLVLLLIDCLFSCFSFVLFVAFIYPWPLRLAMVQNVKDTKENDSG